MDVLLQDAARKGDAEVLEDLLWACWRHHPEEALSQRLNDGTRLIDAGEPLEALAVFDAILGEDPTWTEARGGREGAGRMAACRGLVYSASPGCGPLP